MWIFFVCLQLFRKNKHSRMNQRNLARVFFNWITQRNKNKISSEVVTSLQSAKTNGSHNCTRDVQLRESFRELFRQTSNWSCSRKIWRAARPRLTRLVVEIGIELEYGFLNCRSSFGVLRHWVFQHFSFIFCCFSFVSAPLALSAAISASPKNGNDRKTLPSSLYFSLFSVSKHFDGRRIAFSIFYVIRSDGNFFRSNSINVDCLHFSACKSMLENLFLRRPEPVS